MGAKISILLICIAMAVKSFHVLSQSPTNQSVAVQSGNNANSVRLPFMAQYQTTQVRKPPKGSSITEETTEVIAVDAQGRRMTATTKTPQPGSQGRTRFTIYDPVAHTNISYMSPGTEATVSAIPIGGDFECGYFTAGMFGPSIKTTEEDLGIATIQGVEACGHRSSKTDSFGRRGKDPILLNMLEYWKAVDPGFQGMLVRYISDDRSSGHKTTKELVSFRQSDPAPLMFQLPSRYRIISREV